MGVAEHVLARFAVNAAVAIPVGWIVFIGGANTNGRYGSPSKTQMVSVSEVLVNAQIVAGLVVDQILVGNVILQHTVAVEKVGRVRLGNELQQL